VVAADQILAGNHGVLIGIHKGAPVATPLAEIAGKDKPLDPAFLKMADMLAR
jgi:hypothetical protein